MFQKIIDYLAKLFGIRKKNNPEDSKKEDKRNPDDIYPLW